MIEAFCFIPKPLETFLISFPLSLPQSYRKHPFDTTNRKSEIFTYFRNYTIEASFIIIFHITCMKSKPNEMENLLTKFFMSIK